MQAVMSAGFVGVVRKSTAPATATNYSTVPGRTTVGSR